MVTFREHPNKREVKLESLQPGDRFRSDDFEDGWTYGTLIYSNASRNRVFLDGHQKQVVFGDAEGKRRTFEAQGGCEVSWPLGILVEPEEDWTHTDRSQPKTANNQRVSLRNFDQADDPRERSSTMEGSIAQATGLQARYSFQLKQLADKLRIGTRKHDLRPAVLAVDVQDIRANTIALTKLFFRRLLASRNEPFGLS